MTKYHRCDAGSIPCVVHDRVVITRPGQCFFVVFFSPGSPVFPTTNDHKDYFNKFAFELSNNRI